MQHRDPVAPGDGDKRVVALAADQRRPGRPLAGSSATAFNVPDAIRLGLSSMITTPSSRGGGLAGGAASTTADPVISMQ